MNNRWTANKLGLVNFWYYDVEEFELAEGKLLLKGSNGSGKSVTMQSFIPLLLDGNKAPERLDPFGTKSRTLANYLLDEDTDEKTAYLYIEFKRLSTDNYLTIGMGVKAIKNKPLQSWYFILSDGRRINKDLFLYREAGDMIPLSKKQLENELGEGNFYTESQSKYMEKVNEYLFGFDDIESYEELLNILISIRSPKLSKDFKPTEIYKILTDSLKVLSEEDLRPISDSMENMDNYQATLEENKKAYKAAQNIKYHYDKYNGFILTEKARKLMEQMRKVDTVKKDKDERKKKIKKLEEEFKNKLEEQERMVAELQTAEEKYEGLINREELKLKRDLLELEKRISDNKKAYKSKEGSLEEKKKKDREIEYKLKSERDAQDLHKHKAKGLLEELDYLAEEAHFQEGFEISKEAFEKVENSDKIYDYDFSFLNISLKSYSNKLKEGVKALKLYEDQRQKVMALSEERDEKAKALEEARRDMRRVEELFVNEKENYKVELLKWSQANRVFALSEEEQKRSFSAVDKINDFKDINNISSLVREFYGERENLLKGEIHRRDINIIELNEKISTIEREIEELRKRKDIPFQRTAGVIKNRERLTEEGIPFVPFYKAVDFHKNCDEALKNRLEAALVDMGLIDALIIDEKYKYRALDFKQGMEDRYIFAEPNFMRHNLSSYLKVDKEAIGDVAFQTVDNVLQGIFLEENTLTYVDEKGCYGIGVLRGKGPIDYVQKYIGEASRKRHIEGLIEEKLKVISDLNRNIEVLEKEKDLLSEDLNLLKLEYSKAPSLGNMEEALKLIKDHVIKLKDLDEILIILNNKLYDYEEDLRRIKVECFEKTASITLNHSVSDLEVALEILVEYREKLNEVILMQKDLKHGLNIIRVHETNLEELRMDIDNLYCEINILSRDIKADEIKENAIKKVLETSNLEELEREIDLCLRIRESHPQLINTLSNERGKLENRLEVFRNEISELETVAEHEEGVLKELEHIFEEEYALELLLPKEEGSPIDISKKIVEELAFPQDKNREYYSNNLIESINKNSGDLREYNLKLTELFNDDREDYDFKWFKARKELRCRVAGKDVGFLGLLEEIKKSIEEQSLLINEEERRIFEDVLMNTISQKVKAKIYQSKAWVSKINALMESMDTSSSLKLSLTWTPKKAESEGQLDISVLMDILERGDRCTEEELKSLAKHFGAKVKEALRKYEGSGEVRNYHSIIKEVLDYRLWYEFKLHYTKKGERKKELTNNAFFQFSGGEKAMSMYIPLFSAIYARYEKAKKECPRIITMDEAFAGVDENNIRDMFRLLKVLDLDYILNSQILWGDYDTVESLNIAELIREENDDVVTVLRYHWNGKEKVLVS
ncbi:TIGR02680 family protein [Clostridium thermarum]|uniref:TIGR02680 family protein n=1 Tax=Clostridium thermarum TaxID=1716543 RepID=UPI0013D71CB7|nr:TIGR02680 family protein [Clostridium thermarum]